MARTNGVADAATRSFGMSMSLLHAPGFDYLAVLYMAVLGMSSAYGAYVSLGRSRGYIVWQPWTRWARSIRLGAAMSRSGSIRAAALAFTLAGALAVTAQAAPGPDLSVAGCYVIGGGSPE